MKTTTEPQTETEVIAAWFTEDEVKEWIRARASLYGLPGLILKIDSDKLPFFACGAHHNGKYEGAHTFAEAVEKLKKSLPTPVSLRDQAKALLRQASELESEREISETDELRTEGKKSPIKPNFQD